VIEPTAEQFEQEFMMEEQDLRAVEGLKCEHGIYIARGDSFARYCTACNPGHGKIMRPPMRVALATKQERTLDLAEFFEQPLSERLSFAASMEDMTL
jgi:hypothetical protein